MTRSPFSTTIFTALTEAGIVGSLIVLSLGLGMATVMRASTSSLRRPADNLASTLIPYKKNHKIFNDCMGACVVSFVDFENMNDGISNQLTALPEVCRMLPSLI